MGKRSQPHQDEIDTAGVNHPSEASSTKYDPHHKGYYGRLARPPPPPRDISALLQEIQAPIDVEKSPWAKAFIRHLTTTDQKRVEALFEFALSANYLNTLSKDSDAKEIKAYQLQNTQILENIYDRFFSENASQPIELSNMELRNELHDALHAIKMSSSCSEELLKRTCGLVWEARSDYLVWKVGLDKAYTAFIADKPELPSSLLSAVLLTIL